MNKKYLFFVATSLSITLMGCQTLPTSNSGYLSNYAGGAQNKNSMRASVNEARNDAASDAIERVFIQPAELANGAGSGLKDEEIRDVLYEVDRQICFEISERFTIVPELDSETALIRTSVVRIAPTGQMASGASAVAKVFIPVPFLEVRVPGTLGGLAVESELLAPNSSQQIAFITWGRDAKALGTDTPSLSAVGDALQLAVPMGDAVAAAFSTTSRKARKVPEPDPCRSFGARHRLTGNSIVGAVSGLYVPDKKPEAPK